ncbi:MAG: hypothetical protein V1735_00820 [Nanoarchaeota archaeon]
MKLTALLWILVGLVYATALLLSLVQPKEQDGDIIVPPTPPTNPPPVQPRPPVNPEPDGGDEAPSQAGGITITQFAFDRQNRIIDISFVVKGMQRKAIVTLPTLTYDCVPGEKVPLTIEGLQNMFNNSPVDMTLYINESMLQEINDRMPAQQVCIPKVDDEDSGAQYVYGFSEDITTTFKGRRVDELTFIGIKDLDFRGQQYQDEVEIRNQLVVPQNLQPGRYLMNITVTDKLSFRQDSVAQDFEI